MTHYVVVAEFQVKAERVEAFASAMTKHAVLSRGEPGCSAFEVNQDVTDSRRFLLFERYADEAAYIAHRATEHYARFREIAPDMLVPREGEIFQRRSVLRSIV